jgi:REP element-mobilizing transposase RayT
MSKEFYRRCLPHWQIPQATYFVTYRLAGSIPKAVIERVKAQYLAEVEKVSRNSVPGLLGVENAERVSRNSVPGLLGVENAERVSRNSVPGLIKVENAELRSATQNAELRSATQQLQKELTALLKRKKYAAQKRQFKTWDDFLDSNLNEPHWLKQTAIAELNMEAIKFYDGKQYQLLACTIMSNHIHIMFNLLLQASELSKVMQDLKKYTGLHSNRLLGRKGQFWEEESYDHIVRHNEFERILAYIVNNPVKAGLIDTWDAWPWTFCHESLR